jgi:hypothetical protein
MKFLTTSLIILLGLFNAINAQLYSDSKEMFLEAESYFLFEEYNEALPLYLALLEERPGNDYLKYKIGICYIFTPGQQDKAISFLKSAGENIDWSNRRPNYNTTKAPPDALFHLGKAYHINYRFQEALDVLTRFRNEMNPKVYDMNLVNEYIQATENAIESTRNPIFFLRTNLGEAINSRFSEMNPVVSGNEEMLVFTRRLPFYDGVFFSRKENNRWSEPLEITPQIGSDGDCYPVSLSWDGKELYLYKVDDYIGNIYVSTYERGEWTRIRKLNENINTKYWESHASISRDGLKLYFTSNRPGGLGDLDIYVSERSPGGDWGPAVNLGAPVNTPFNEETCFISEDGETLYFSSYGHFNIGGYDFFYSNKLKDGTWSVPLNMGYPLSTPDDDLFLQPVKQGQYAYVYRSNPDRPNGVTDIYRLEIFSDTHPRKFRLAGKLSRFDDSSLSRAARIIIIDKLTRDTLYNAMPDLETGDFDHVVSMGDYRVILQDEGFVTKEISLNLPYTHPVSDIDLNTRLEALAVEIEEEPEDLWKPWWNDLVPITRSLGIENHLIRVSTPDPVSIRMNLQRNSRLRVETWVDDQMVKADSFDIRTRRFDYEFTPIEGRALLKIYFLNRNEELIRDEVTVIYVPEQETIETEFEVSGTLRNFYDELVKSSSGDLRNVLLGVDFRDLNITAAEELVDYLLKQAEFNDYTGSDVKLLLLEIASRSSADAASFLELLKASSEGDLLELFRGIDLDKEGITSIAELNKLIDKRSEESGLDKELIDLLIRMIENMTSQDKQDVSLLYNELLKAADGEPAKALVDLADELETIQNPHELIDAVLSKGAEYNYTDRDVERLLLRIIDSKNLDVNLLKSMWAGFSVPSLADIIAGTTADASEPFSVFALQAIEKAEKAGIDRRDILRSLTSLAIFATTEAGKEMNYLLSSMRRLADGPLKKYLDGFDPEEAGVSTSRELISYLIDQADYQEYTEEDVIRLLARIAGEGDLEGLLNDMSSLSSGGLEKLLKSIDLGKQNIRSTDELINYLLANAADHGFTADDVRAIVSELAISRVLKNQADIDMLKQNMQTLGSPGIRMAIQQLESSGVTIDTPSRFIEELSRLADDFGYTDKDIWGLIFELGKEGMKDIDELIAALRKIATGGILKALNDIDQETIRVADVWELYNYLVSRADELGYTEQDVKDLFLRQALENQKLLKEGQRVKKTGFGKTWWFWIILALLAIYLSYRYVRRSRK